MNFFRKPQKLVLTQKLLTHLSSIRKKLPNGFKKFAYRNLEQDARHDQLLNV